MHRSNAKLAAVETYLTELRRVRASGGATGERSSYGPLANLLNAVGATLRPKVFCVAELADQGAGHPDFGLFTARQVQRGRPRHGQAPERGVVEVKTPRDSTRATAVREQVSRYWGRYGLVLVTNLREFELVGPDAENGETILESFRLAGSQDEFERLLEAPQSLARAAGAGLGEYLRRALSHRSTIPLPAWSDGTAGTTPASAEETTKMRTTAGAARMLAESAARGRELVRLLDPDTPVPGVTVGALRPEIAVIAVPSTVDGRNMTADDFAIAAGWGHFGRGDAVMPGQGRTVERVCTPVERTAVSEAMPALGEMSVDVHLNDRAFMAQRARQGLVLPPRRLPGAREVALLPRARSSAGRSRPTRSSTSQTPPAASRRFCC